MNSDAKIDGKQVANWVLRMIPILMAEKINPAALVCALLGSFSMVQMVSKEVDKKLMEELVIDLKVHIDMIMDYPEDEEKRLVEVNRHILERHHKFK